VVDAVVITVTTVGAAVELPPDPEVRRGSLTVKPPVLTAVTVPNAAPNPPKPPAAPKPARAPGERLGRGVPENCARGRPKPPAAPTPVQDPDVAVIVTVVASMAVGREATGDGVAGAADVVGRESAVTQSPALSADALTTVVRLNVVLGVKLTVTWPPPLPPAASCTT
jgi:hypothetical protein